MHALSSWVTRLQHIGADRQDDDETRLRKSILVSASTLVILAAAIWSFTYILFNEPLAGLVSLLYALITLGGLAWFASSHRYRLFLFIQLVLGLVVPLAHTLLLGGLWNSSVVILWSLGSPLGALLFYPTQRARLWRVAYLLVLGTAVALHPIAEHANNLPRELVRAFFALNIGGVSSICLVILNYFISQKNEAYRLLHLEQQKAENLLLNVLPQEIAAILKNEERTIADSFDGASVLFADLVGFTALTAHMLPKSVVELLNDIFSHFDSLVEKYGVEKIRTMGDNYMVAAGVPRAHRDHAQRLVAMALEMQDYIRWRREQTGFPVEFRIGINSGPVIGGVIGHKKFVYDVWGDAVNIASRMESHGVAGTIQITQTTYELVRDRFVCQRRGWVELKGRGMMETWFVLAAKGETEWPHRQAVALPRD
jgi:guanylate cyclase